MSNVYKPLVVKELIELLSHYPKNTKVYLAGDEEGNTFARVYEVVVYEGLDGVVLFSGGEAIFADDLVD